jgi:nitric oxide reductase NorQ protein
VAIVAREAGIDMGVARQLVAIAQSTRALKQRGLDEGASTRLLIYAGLLVRDGLTLSQSCEMTMVQSLTDDPDIAAAIRDLVDAQLQ